MTFGKDYFPQSVTGATTPPVMETNYWWVRFQVAEAQATLARLEAKCALLDPGLKELDRKEIARMYENDAALFDADAINCLDKV